MRIDRLDLLRYGKFTDSPVRLPRMDRDFHVIVGPNETGKSTIRSAIVDLLYGIPKNTPQAFLHAMSDMRLAASIDHDGNALEFHRIKGNKQTLRTPSDAVLPDGALSAYLGTTDREFFDQMFGLDHEKLVAGGHSILSAANDIGQILFQSAAGIADLGKVRDALEAEADSLWAKRKSGDRAYYIAAEDLERAVTALKASTVRSKDWSEADGKVTRLEEDLLSARQRHSALKTRKDQLERVRRVSPYLASIREKQGELFNLGPTSDLPPSAGQTLLDAEREVALAEAAHKSHVDRSTEATEKLELVQLDELVLSLSADISALDAQRLQFRAHERDIALRQAEVDGQWKAALEAAAQLGWIVDSEDSLLSKLPSLPVRKSLEKLVRTHGALAQALDGAVQAEAIKSGEVQYARNQFGQLPAAEVPAALQAALTAAQKLGDATATRQARHVAVSKKAEELEMAQLALGIWRADVPRLVAMPLPSASLVESFNGEQLTDDAEVRAISKRIQILQGEIKAKELDIAQYQQSHRAVTRDQVVEARKSRDGLWESFKTDHQALVRDASDYEQLVVNSDGVADAHHDTIQETSELQAKLYQVDRVQLELEEAERHLANLADGGAQRASRWASVMDKCGLQGMRPDAFTAWATARTSSIAADEALRNAERALKEWDEVTAIASTAVAMELVALNQPAASSGSLSAVVLQASTFIQSMNDAHGQRRALQQQIEDGEDALVGLRTTFTNANTRMEEWKMSWAQTVKQAGLAQGTDVAEAEGALTLLERIEGAVMQMRKLRTERIDPMRVDLEKFSDEAKRLVAAIDAGLFARPAADVATELAGRLARATEAKTEATRLEKEVRDADRKAADALAQVDTAQASLRPLMERAGATSNAELLDAISRSDTKRRIQEAITAAEKGLRDGGDGLSQQQLAAEVDDVDQTQLSTEMDNLSAKMDSIIDEQTALSASRQEAASALAKIAGSSEAARAEAQRQEALAKMSDAVERYVKVLAAARLLKWSIEKYREAKQGPMLSLAGAIFAKLTLGSFERLTVDYESEPLTLQGRRPNGEVVGIDGLSEGARDQLYLALRLAALDMHLGQAHALPFIADDLFVNFDDQRAGAGITALGELSKKTQVIFLTHHNHLVPVVREVLGKEVNVVAL